MRRSWPTVMGGAAALLLAACGGHGARVLGDNPAPVTSSTSTAAAATSSSAAPTSTQTATTTSTHTAARSTATIRTTTSRSTSTRSTSTRSTSTRSTTAHSTTSSHGTTSSTAAPCSGAAGATTTIREVAGYRFSPATVTIERCGYVEALYADSTGSPHTWQGATWNSGNMTSSSNSSYRIRFTKAGTFNFFCAYHQSLGMTGSVKVS